MADLRGYLRKIVELLVDRDYSELERLSKGQRMSALEMVNAVAAYGRTLTMPSEGAFLPDIIPLKDSSLPAWSIVIPLYTIEEGGSDLSLELVVLERRSGEFEIEVEDLHVL